MPFFFRAIWHAWACPPRDRSVIPTTCHGLPALAAAAAITLGGCASVGPRSVVRDRFDYNSAISTSLKEQTLLNIVKLRYLDVPVFVEVAQVINSYEVQGSASARGTMITDPDVELGVGGSYTVKPTITYTPLTGNQYVRGLMTPLPPEVVFFLIQSGYAADLILRTTVSSINGVLNEAPGVIDTAAADGRFLRATTLFRTLQRAGALTLSVHVRPSKERVAVVTFGSTDQPADLLAARAELESLLSLSPGAPEHVLVFGGLAPAPGEIAVQTRSLIQIMGALSARVDIPAPHHDVAFPVTDALAGAPPLFRVHSSIERPVGAHVAVPHRGHWFWIDDTDLATKRVFATVVLLFSLGDSNASDGLPIVTVPVN